MGSFLPGGFTRNYGGAKFILFVSANVNRGKHLVAIELGVYDSLLPLPTFFDYCFWLTAWD